MHSTQREILYCQVKIKPFGRFMSAKCQLLLGSLHTTQGKLDRLYRNCHQVLHVVVNESKVLLMQLYCSDDH